MTFPEYRVAILLGVFYLALHLLLYVLVLRMQPLFRSEEGIFLYHFASATVFAVVSLATALVHASDAAVALAFALIAIHCIYSISFLELWTLAEGSYSMSILTGIASQETLSRKRLIDAFASIGDAKKGNRLSVLSGVSLACRKGSHWQLTARGRAVAEALNLLTWLAAIKNRG